MILFFSGAILNSYWAMTDAVPARSWEETVAMSAVVPDYGSREVERRHGGVRTFCVGLGVWYQSQFRAQTRARVHVRCLLLSEFVRSPVLELVDADGEADSIIKGTLIMEAASTRALSSQGFDHDGLDLH